MSSFQIHRELVLKLFPQVAGAAREKPEMLRRLEEAERRLRDGKLTVVVAGEFKQGKSSLINALLDEPDLFPVDIDIATNLVSTITYGPVEKLTVLLGKPGEPAREARIERADIPHYVTEQRNPRNERGARLLVIESPNPKLSDGLLLVDTPGVGGLDARHTDITYAFLPNADVVLFVSDALAPLTEIELDFIASVARICDTLFFVTTKIDLARNWREIVTDNRAKLAATLDRPETAITIVPVSSRARLAYLASGDPEDLEDSNFPALETEIWRLLTGRRGYILLMRAIGELNRSLGEVKAPLLAEREAYLNRSRQELDAYEQQLSAARDRMEALTESGAKWRRDLPRGLRAIGKDLQTDVDRLFTRQRRRIDELLDEAQLRKQPVRVAERFEQEIAETMTLCAKELSRRAALLSQKIEAESGLQVQVFEVDIAGRLREEAEFDANRVQLEGWESKSWTVTRNSMLTMGLAGTAGGAIGAVIGSFFGGVGAIPGVVIGKALGLSLGSVAGLAGGARQALSQNRRQDKAAISRILLEFLEDAQKFNKQALDDSFTELEQAMIDDLDQQFTRERRRAEEALKALQTGRARPDDEVKRRLDTVQRTLKQLDQVAQRLSETATAVAALDNTADRPPSNPAGAGRPVPVAAASDGWADDDA